jgi:hypothetical protein
MRKEKREKSGFTLNPHLGLLLSPGSNQPNNFTFWSVVPMRVRAILEVAAPAGPRGAPECKHG